MALTEKGTIALAHIQKYFPTGAFSAKDLSDACGEKIAAATLNGVANNGYIKKLGGSPVQFEVEDDLEELLASALEEQKNKASLGTTLRKAKNEKNDEFYTCYEDIEIEVMKYRKQFKGKVVYLPCDDPAEKKSEFWSFFVNNFDAFGLKKLIATHFDENGKAYKIWIDSDTSGDGYIDDADALQEDLIGNGDFRSPECLEILKECDIVCTNPPFSMFREFVNWLITNEKQFLIIGNNNALAYKEIFPLVKNNKIWCGYTTNKTMTFKVGEGYKFDEKLTSQINDGNLYGKVPAITWFTNLKTTKRTEKIILTKEYNSINYPKYDNYNAIEVSRVSDIPKDYSGFMGVPITFLNNHNPEQFEIIGAAMGWSNAAMTPEFKELVEYDENIISDCGTRGYGIVNGKQKYHRVLIKAK